MPYVNQPARRRCPWTVGLCCAVLLQALFSSRSNADWRWDEHPNLPNELGVAGPVVGVHGDALICAGGANFPKPVWDHPKQWLDQIYVLTGSESDVRWIEAGRLPRPLAYAASVSTPEGIVCIGGNNASDVFTDVLLLRWNGRDVAITELPNLRAPNVYGQATLVGSKVYLVGGQTDVGLETATADMWSLDLANFNVRESMNWVREKPLPGPARAFNMVAAQHNGFHDCLYVMGGRRIEGETTEFLADVWEFAPATNDWRQRANMPIAMMAGTSIGFGQSHVFVMGAATSENFDRVDELRDNHPGFPRQSFAYHTITDTWVRTGETPLCQVTTTPVLWRGEVVVASGEVRPRVRTPKVFRVRPMATTKSFGTINYVVLFGYLLSMIGVGVYFARRNKTTDQYFRGGQSIPWWAAGCSIFATMLSSLTYTGVPSKAYAQDWVYSIGNLMIPVVAFVAVYVALPFFRRIDATSAYEYLEKRFNRAVRLFGSASFTLFHVFRMAVVMSLTGLALAVATPLTPTQSVLLMGVLSILYCTMGGIEAVIWTDTIQTFVLLGGAAIAIVVLLTGVDGGWDGFLTSAKAGGKLNVANMHWDPTSGQIALWVIVIGGIAQNVSSYTADQAVVQRYMTTADQRLAARSIWTNAILTIPATTLFFGIGTALYAYYRSHPEKLDPTITTDQIFPLFIAREMPIGVAGLLVAGIFAAAQSTVSTSMNSTATTLVTDALRPLNVIRTERAYLAAARVCTFVLGVLGTWLALLFIDPDIRSLFDQFIKVIGLFMGVLGGLFVLGALTRRANGFGALVGAFAGAAVMVYLWRYSNVNGYLYTASGITACVSIGYVSSLFVTSKKDLTGLTVYETTYPR